MTHPYFLLQPLLWSVGFAVGGIVLKRAIEGGAGALRIAFLNNLTIGLMFLPGLLLLPHPLPWPAIAWALVASLVYTTGQIFFFLAMRLGDVTVLAPAMGAKVVFVAFFTFILGAGAMPWNWWVAAFLAAAAVFLLGMSNWHDRKRLAFTAVLAVTSAAIYGLNDLIVQMHAQALSPLGFSAVMFGGVAAESFLIVPFFREPLRKMPLAVWPWALGGSILCAAQSGGMAFTLGHYGQATAINIVYSTRGLWSVLLVWLAGPWFGNQERTAGTGVMGRRLGGALLLLLAVALVIL